MLQLPKNGMLGPHMKYSKCGLTKDLYKQIKISGCCIWWYGY